MDITRFADRDMALQWWDTYTDENIMAIQQEVSILFEKNFFFFFKKFFIM